MTPRQTAAKRRSRGWDDDPMVPVLPDRLRAAVEEAGRSLGTLAQELSALTKTRENRQTLHHLVQAPTPTRCRRSRLRGLAKLLDVPFDWLAGRAIELPLTTYGQLALLEASSPRVALALARLTHKAIGACRRDLESYRVELPPEPREETLWPAADDVVSTVSAAFCAYALPSQWRGRMVRIAIPPRELTVQDKHDLESGAWPRKPYPPLVPEEQSAAIALTRGLDFTFNPWFRGEAPLDYSVFREFVHAIVGLPSRWPSHTIRPDAVVRPDGKRVPPEDPSTPYCLLTWRSPTTDTREAPRPRKRGKSQ